MNEILQDPRFELVGELPKDPVKIEGYYVGDLLSYVMASKGQLWLTVQAHPNVLAVASLLELSAVMVVEDAEIPQETIETAQEKGIILMKTACPAVEALRALFDWEQ